MKGLPCTELFAGGDWRPDTGSASWSTRNDRSFLWRTRGQLRANSVWEELRERPVSSPDRWHQTLVGCFPARQEGFSDLSEGVDMCFEIAIGYEAKGGIVMGMSPAYMRTYEVDHHPPLLSVASILKECRTQALYAGKVHLLTQRHGVDDNNSTWSQLIDSGCLLVEGRQSTTLRVHMAQPVGFVSFRLNIEGVLPICSVRISVTPSLVLFPSPSSSAACSLSSPGATPTCPAPLNHVPLQMLPWLSVVSLLNLESIVKLRSTSRTLRRIVDSVLALPNETETETPPGADVPARWIQYHGLDRARPIQQFAQPFSESRCFLFALEDQSLFQSESAEFAHRLLNTRHVVCELSCTHDTSEHLQLFYGANRERGVSGPTLTFESWTDEAKHTVELVLSRTQQQQTTSTREQQQLSLEDLSSSSTEAADYNTGLFMPWPPRDEGRLPCAAEHSDSDEPAAAGCGVSLQLVLLH